MKNETLMIAFSNQKGGVGKSTMTILLASYLHYTKNLNVAVVDCDSPQYSLGNMRERDKQAVMKSDLGDPAGEQPYSLTPALYGRFLC